MADIKDNHKVGGDDYCNYFFEREAHKECLVVLNNAPDFDTFRKALDRSVWQEIILSCDLVCGRGSNNRLAT